MNERIQQMIYNLNEKVGVHWTNEDKLKFAELIVRECLSLARSYPSQNDDYAAGIDSVRDSIKQHFGV